MPTEMATPKNKPLMSPTVSLPLDQKTNEFGEVNINSRYMPNNNSSISYDDRHLSDSNPHLISLSMYPGMNNKNMISQFPEKNVKIETNGLNDKRDDDYDVNDEGELFPILTKEKIIEIKRFEQEIKTKSDDEKINLAINSLKIKRHPVTL